ncbi:MAG TPA: flagellar motor stator protein MotA [Opitutus sp.]|nr:flagellar motor stator protein MotA [Opitutus sp.]
MLIFVGVFIVLASTLGGFMLAGGHPGVLLHVSEFIVILGIALGVLVIATPTHVIKEIIHKLGTAITGKTTTRADFFDLLKLLYEIFMIGRRNGLIALEEHISDPGKSPVFQKYPTVTAHHERLAFIISGFRPIIDGKIKPDQLESLMKAELSAKENESEHPVHAMQLIGDSLPAIGIVGAVLGIINTMSAIADGPEKVGEKVASALTGTLLGVFAAYGFVNPLAGRIRANNSAEHQCLRCILEAIVGFAKGLAPLTAIEIARRSLDSSVQPDADELEQAVKSLGTK